MIEIIKASAGSGKTFTLAKKYLKLLLETEDRYAYRHVLAVTFTNKATDEMKSRILQELHILATEPESSDYYEEFVPHCYPDNASIMEAARTVLCNILHDYGAFAVSTIDSFFQQALKAFAREIGQFASYQIELDRGSLITESVDRVLDSMTGDKKDEKKLKWLTDNVITQLEKGEGYKLDYALKNVALRLKDEEHRVLIEKEGIDESVVYSEQGLEDLSKGCKTVCEKYLTMLKDAAQRVWDTFTQAGLDPNNTSRKFMANWLGKYLSIKDPHNIPLPTDAFRDTCAKPEKWFAKANAHMEHMVTSDIMDALDDFFALFGLEYKVYNTALLLKAQVYGFRIARELHDEFEALLKEKNVLSLDDSNTILKNIIDGTETPFIYEKMGVRYENFLLDEFQDTSRVQWENFRPLLKNSIDSGFYNLIVGDVKQSIYRFRDSDWKLLRDEAPAAFGKNVKPDTLKENYRSFGNIVRFNNSFFKEVAGLLDTRYGFKDKGVIASIYEDVEQLVKKKGDGCVKLNFCPREYELNVITEAIAAALDKGYEYKDIAILVRTNDDGALIASHLIENGIRVVTDDSLQVSSSLTIRRLVSLMSSIDNPDDTTAKYLASHLDIEIPRSYSSIIDLCEDLLRKLKVYNETIYDAEVLYVQSFMDILRDYVESKGNNLHLFLKYWAETKSRKATISSPKIGDAVRIITIHKSKGLAFRYVIVPYVEVIGLARFEKKWCKPDVKGTALEGVAEGIYDVTLSGKSEQTLFAPHYKEETLLQYVDNLNVVYVAMTRAKECMEIVASLPEDGKCKDVKDMDNFSDILYWYANKHGEKLGLVAASAEKAEGGEPEYAVETYVYGTIPEVEKTDEEENEVSLHAAFCSWPLNPEDGQKGRLRLNADASDFFSEDGVGTSASQRIKGIILHEIMAAVGVPGDLDQAVRSAVTAGKLSSDEARQVLELLRQRIESVKSEGWYPDDRSCVLNETAVIDDKGTEYRPDRVVRQGRSVRIVDYKFGEHNAGYEAKLRKYADVWTEAGYLVESAKLWYVHTGEIIRVV